MKQSVPAIPLLLLIISLILIGLSAWAMTLPVGMAPIDLRSDEAAPQTASDRKTVDQVVIFTPTPVKDSTRDILGRSPFIAERTAFSRTPPRRAAPPPPQHKPELVGIFGKGDTRAAMIVWSPGAPASNHTVGSSSPWGVIARLDANRVVFAKDGEERTLSMFE